MASPANYFAAFINPRHSELPFSPFQIKRGKHLQDTIVPEAKTNKHIHIEVEQYIHVEEQHGALQNEIDNQKQLLEF